MSSPPISLIFKIYTISVLLVGTITGGLGMELIAEAETFWQKAVCWLIAIVVSIVLYGLWTINEKIFITINPVYRDKRLWAVHILTPIFAVLVSGMASYVCIFHKMAYRLHMEAGIYQTKEALDNANTSSQRLLLFKEVVKGKAGTLNELAEGEKSGLLTGRGGEGEVYRRIKEAEGKLAGISDLLVQSEITVSDLNSSAKIQIQRMRRAIPTKGSALEGLEAYTKAQRNFYTDFQTLSEQNIALQVKTMLGGFENTMVGTTDPDQAAHIARINRHMSEIAESLIAAMEEQTLKIEKPKEWSIGSPVYLSLLYIIGGFNIAIMTILLEISPIFLIWAMWAKHREFTEEDLGNKTIELDQLNTLTVAIKEILDLNKEHNQDKDGDK